MRSSSPGVSEAAASTSRSCAPRERGPAGPRAVPPSGSEAATLSRSCPSTGRSRTASARTRGRSGDRLQPGGDVPLGQLGLDELQRLAHQVAQRPALHRERVLPAVLAEEPQHPLQGADLPLGDGEPALVPGGEPLVAGQGLDRHLHRGERVAELVAERAAQRGDLQRRGAFQERVEVEHPGPGHLAGGLQREAEPAPFPGESRSARTPPLRRHAPGGRGPERLPASTPSASASGIPVRGRLPSGKAPSTPTRASASSQASCSGRSHADTPMA